MATSGDVTVAQDGGANVRLHPYLVTLVRWCMSYVWSTATVLFHRLMSAPLQPITGPKAVPVRGKIPHRAAGTEHLHPEPRVECQLLHHPAVHTMDVIFVHGLYGSLGNTWRQGDWRQKYESDPKIVTLRDHSKQNSCNCHKKTSKHQIDNDNKSDDTKTREKSLLNHTHDENKCDDTKISENSYKDHIHSKNKCDDVKINENTDITNNIYNNNKCDDNITQLYDTELSFKKINEELSKKIIPQENELITEQFYNNTLMDQVNIVHNYDTQAKFVSDLFKKETDCDKNCENIKERDQIGDNDFKFIYNKNNISKYNNNSFELNRNRDNGFELKENDDGNNNFKCNKNDFNECKCGSEEKNCEVGCGCSCNDCYSTCWPRDWIREDFPGARVISINYTSDPYLWRPLWIKENKRLNLYQRAEQMIDQLLKMGVGQKPIVWVGHSKGGLFIKQIYCEAYEAYMKTNKNPRTKLDTKPVFPEYVHENSPDTHNGITAENIDTIISHFRHEEEKENDYTRNDDNYTIDSDDDMKINDEFTRKDDKLTNVSDNCSTDNNNYKKEGDNYAKNDNYRNKDNIAYNNTCVINEQVEYENVFEQTIAKNDNNANLEYVKVISDNIRSLRIENGCGENIEKLDGVELGSKNLTSSIEDCSLSRRASLWSSSRGFMFYSVPHRGSPLADIKTPVTARSVDLLEIAKDCPLVLELQSRWEQAVRPGARSPPAVRSVVETCRTLMSVLWLRIVSAQSADAGIGLLSGISVDHREICKPTSRACRLYTMLTELIHDAVACSCREL